LRKPFASQMEMLIASMSEVRAGARPANMALRVATLGSRFALTIYIAKSLGIEDLGIFGFVMGLVGVVPPLTGWGVNYFLGREVVGRSLNDAAVIIRNRLVVTLASLAAILPFAPALYALTDTLPAGRIALVTAIVIAETISADLQPPLISLGMSLFANIMLFVRSSAWMYIYIPLATIAPSYRTIDTAFELWLAFNCIQFVLLYIIVLRRLDLHRLLSEQFPFGQMFASIIGGMQIYANDVGTAGLLYVDRYFVAAMLGGHALGVYTLYWSIANGVNALISSGIIQPATPVLVLAHIHETPQTSARLLRKVLTNTLVVSLGLGMSAVLAAWLVLTYLRLGDFQANYPFLLLLLLASTLRGLSDAINLALASRHMDRAYAVTGIAGMALAAPLNVMGLRLFGLIGVAFAACITQAAVIFFKWRLLQASSVQNRLAC
jgi:O-antigen/teichoic acid export membrane protein